MVNNKVNHRRCKIYSDVYFIITKMNLFNPSLVHQNSSLCRNTIEQKIVCKPVVQDEFIILFSDIHIYRNSGHLWRGLNRILQRE